MMRSVVKTYVVGGAVAWALLAGAGGAMAQIPDKYTNLQVYCEILGILRLIVFKFFKKLK